MKNRNSSRTGLFLMELILAVLFFSLAGAICVQLFVNSHIVSQNSVDLNNGVLWAQNTAEAFYGCNGDVKEMSALFSNCLYETAADGSDLLILFFDEEFQPAATLPAPDTSLSDDMESYLQLYPYLLSAVITPAENNLSTCSIKVHARSEKDVIYEIDVTLFSNKEAAND